MGDARGREDTDSWESRMDRRTGQDRTGVIAACTSNPSRGL